MAMFGFGQQGNAANPFSRAADEAKRIFVGGPADAAAATADATLAHMLAPLSTLQQAANTRNILAHLLAPPPAPPNPFSQMAQRYVPPPQSTGGQLARLLLGAALPVPKAAAAAKVAEEVAPIIAYHGSPHPFDTFELGKIGTGEGNQAYGHGLYFAENENTAKSYRNALSRTITLDGRPIYSNGQRLGTTGDGTVDAMLIDHGGDIDAAMADPRYHLRPVGGGEPRLPDYTRQQLEALRGRVAGDTGGHMYQVGINADPQHFIDWDKPFEQQSPHVQSVLSANGYSAPADYLAPQYRTMGYTARSDLTRPEEASRLAEQGIAGIRYLDAGSRGTGQGTSNYVVFNPDTIDILKRYGIIGGIGGGLFGAQYANQTGGQ